MLSAWVVNLLSGLSLIANPTILRENRSITTELSGLAASVGTTGDSYDNALAESVNGLYKTEVIDYFKLEWNDVNDVALATLDWVHWYNYERLHSTNAYLSPIDAESIYYRSLKPSGYAA
jgi:putative transposase